MDCNKTIDFFSGLKRLCESRASCEAGATNKERCPMFGFCEHVLASICAADVETAIETVQKWSDKRSKKTYAQDFFEKFPDAPKDEAVKGNCPWACRIGIYGGGCPKIDPEIDCCYECWNEPMEE